MLHGRDVEAGVQPRVSTGQSIHAVLSITPSLREGIEDGPRLRADPLGLSNWRMTQKIAFDLHNKTGSDVFIATSTMAG
jgi:hypothetical protein